MNCVILGGDKRYYEIINNFLNKGYNVDIVGYKNIIKNTHQIDINDLIIEKYDVIIFPISGVTNNFIIKAEENFKVSPNILNNAKDDSLIFSGINTPCLEIIKFNSKKNITFLMKDKEIIEKNAIPTVEGIIGDLIKNTNITIKDSNIMVIGYGNIGKYLVEILKHLGSNITVSIIEKKDKNILDKYKIKNVFSNDFEKMCNVLTNQNIIINTVPSLVINKNYIDYLNNECYVLDVSSYPHGIDKEYLDYKNIKNKIYMGIPSDIAPKTSGIILSKKIDSIIGGILK